MMGRLGSVLKSEVTCLLILWLFLIPFLFVRPYAARIYGLIGYGLIAVLLLCGWGLRKVRTQEELPLTSPAGRVLGVWVGAYLAWCLVSAALSPFPHHSALGVVSLLAGGVVFLVLVCDFRRRSQLRLLILSLAILSGLLVLRGLAVRGQSFSGMTSVYRDRQLLGAVLGLFLPLLTAAAAGTHHRTRRHVLQLATVSAATGLALSQCRSAWLGGVTGLLLFGVLGVVRIWSWRRLSPRKHRVVTSGLLLACAVGLALFNSRGLEAVSARASTLRHVYQDPSVQDRMQHWSQALRVASLRPLLGWGTGTYAFAAASLPERQRSLGSIRVTGPSLLESPHNWYLEMAAEQGLIGLGLYLGVLLTLFRLGWRAASRMENGFRKHLLLGSLAAIGGQSVDALANPAWSFPEVGTFLWVVMGISGALITVPRVEAHVQSRSRDHARPPRPYGSPGWQYGIVVLLAGLLSLCLLQLDPLRTASAAIPAQPSYKPCQGPGACCPGSVEYWAANQDSWPEKSLKLGSRSYNKSALVTLITASASNDASLQLAQQLIASRLNVSGGVDPELRCPSGATATAIMDQADTLLAAYAGNLPYNVSPASSAGVAMIAKAAELAEFNSGARTAGCSSCAGP